MSNMTQEFDFVKELNQEILRNLTTSFGLDFIMMEDKRGGNVDTTHKVREYQKEGEQSDIHINATNNKAYQEREKYDSHAYHTDSNYKNKGRADKKAHQAGELYDPYLGGKLNGDRQLDHTISANEIHHDRARHLAGIDGVILANRDTNLNSTNWYVNNLKRAHSMEHFLNEIVPKKQNALKQTILKNEQIHSKMPMDTPAERHKARQVQDRIQADKEKLNTLNEVEKNANKLRKADEIARSNANKEVDKAYYMSSKFAKAVAADAVHTGIKMGMRQAIGMVLAEVWFELKDFLAHLFNKKNRNFELGQIWDEIKAAFANIFSRIKSKFKDLLNSFKDGLVGGIFSAVTSVIVNMFTVASRQIGKIIREMWQTLVSVIKLIFFNPDKLSLSDLIRSAVKLIALAVATFLGVMLDSYLTGLFAFPFGSEIAAFLSALCTGILTVTMVYFIDYSSIMKKVWAFLDQFKSGAERSLDYFKKVNQQLDQYLLEIAQVEFNFNTKELAAFNDSLEATTCEYERGYLLSQEIKRRNIELPFEDGNHESVRDWLKSCLT